MTRFGIATSVSSPRIPGIFGKLTMKWVIDKDGQVTTVSAAENEMPQADVDGCLVKRIKDWTFPQPKGGGIVIVTYPFIFRQGKDEPRGAKPAPSTPEASIPDASTPDASTPEASKP